MSEKTAKPRRKQGQRRNNFEIPQRFLDRLTADGSNFIPTQSDAKELNTADVLTLDKLFKQYYSARQVAGAASRTLENYIKHMGWLRKFMAPFDNIDLMKVPEEDFEVITKAQERKLFEICDLNTLLGIRDALMLSFLLDTGVRIGECVRILADDVDLTNRSVLVRGESAKSEKQGLCILVQEPSNYWLFIYNGMRRMPKHLILY